MSGRGRGKRATTTKTATTATTDATDVVEEKPVKKTARKKQFPVVAIITPEGIEGNLLPEVKRPLIVHLPIQSKNVLENDMLMKYDPNPPSDAQPYDMNADNPFYDEVEHIPEPVPNATTAVVSEPSSKEDTAPSKPVDTTIQGAPNAVTTAQEPIVDFYGLKSTLLVQYKDTADTKTIPASSDAACLWCCHTFTNRPVVLPIRDTGEHLIVHGNFCCPECACAYLFDMRQDSHTRWEQLALLYRVYGEACDGKIHPAPSRMVLTLFGGNLSIQEYRALIQSHKVRVDIHLPPMVSILATMDTKPIDFYDSGLTKAVSETVKERLQKAEEVLRLRRTKPLKAWESTLDACLNLKIRHDR
jgi:hypothetical protein